MTAKKKRLPKNLARGRPPNSQKPNSISRKATRSLINTHHLLEKKKAQAASRGDRAAEAAFDAEIAALGGIQTYQQASLQGQRNDRGGDSSRVLMEWIKPIIASSDFSANVKPRMLEVGALSVTNECSRTCLFDIERIDLNSQSDGIVQQDFMERPLPSDDSERFDIISLSLVLNFVPDALGRGNMLLRTHEFLRKATNNLSSAAGEWFPSLFMVLPAPCISNSRYMDGALLERIMNALGYTKLRSKMTNKLVYFLWARKPGFVVQACSFKKTELRSGPSRNNFAIVVQKPMQ
ncbi:putative methyltransferase-domain-containing protein [Xylariomycetidae sp. FL2044]|nr:putative methyltransferase-domain-containing protein [Xylariomycetidae sp. FL2044]